MRRGTIWNGWYDTLSGYRVALYEQALRYLSGSRAVFREIRVLFCRMLWV